MKIHLLLIGLFTTIQLFGQEMHNKPDHPKGLNSADQYAALPFYNEACELYKKGHVNAAKNSLYESINTSFALTEAQLFLAQIMYEQGKLDSAMLYFNSGIDFAVEQLPHYYFYFFETGLKMGQYDLVKHNMKHFKKLYGNVATGKYEENYPFTVDDLELYNRSIALTTDYNFWQPRATVKDTLKATDFVTTTATQTIVVNNNKVRSIIQKKRKEKTKKFLFTAENYNEVQITASGKYAFFQRTNGDKTTIWYTAKNGKKWKDAVELPAKINQGTFNGYPFFLEEEELLYFSSNRGGNKDLFVAKINLDNNTVERVEPLTTINTKYDEVNPAFYGETFYFASNGHATFGGFDLYQTTDLMRMNGVIYPRTARNMGKPFNSNKDETALCRVNNTFIIKRANFAGTAHHIRMIPLKQEQQINFEIQPVKIGENAH